MQKIELTDKDAESFLLFREHQDFIELMIKQDINTLKNANMALSFDSNGTLRKIVVEKVVFKI